MKSLPDEFDERLVGAALAESWEFEATSVEYAAVGFGSYHWIATRADGDRAFVTVDDLDRKPWLGDTRESVLEALARCFDTAAGLRELGLAFVVAPVRTLAGDTIRRVAPRHALAVFPYVEGDARSFDDTLSEDERAALVRALAELHGASPTTGLRRGHELAAADGLRAALGQAGTPWTGGPYAEPGRRLLARHATAVDLLLEEYGRLAGDVERESTPCVTHGEPHPGNLIAIDGGVALVDWDTVALAPAERDLWMLGGDDRGLYAELTGREPDPAALELFRLAWDLNDLAAHVSTFRSAHSESEDAAAEYDRFARLLQSVESRGG